MGAGKQSVRRRAFYVVLGAELVGWLSLLPSSSGGSGRAPLGGVIAFYVVVWSLLVLGVLNALMASLPRPRWTVAVVTLALHALAILLLGFQFRPGQLSEYRAHEDERQSDAASQQRWAAELTSLIVAGRPREALAYVDEHPFMVVGDGEPFRDALCPRDGSAPDYPLLLKLGERGAPSGGGRLVASARCSLPAFRALMEVSQRPATDTTDDGRSALFAASDPALLQYLLEQGLELNARDARGRTPLMSHRSVAVTRFLLEHGADARALDKQGYSVLHFGGPRDQLGEIFELLLDAGADPNQQADAGPPLHQSYGPLDTLACYQDRSRPPFEGLHWSQRAADALVEHGASAADRLSAIECCMLEHDPIEDSLRWPGLDLAGTGGAELLVWAAQHRDYIPALLAAGANPLSINHEGESGLQRYEAHMRPLPGDKTYALLREAARRFASADAGLTR